MIEYKIDQDYEDVEIQAIDGKEIIGYINFEILHDDDIAKEFFSGEGKISEKLFNKFFSGNDIVKIDLLEVDEQYRKQGIGRELLGIGLKFMIKKGWREFYLNACVIGNKQFKLSDLVNFYKKFGFRVIERQGKNVLMGMIYGS